VVTISQARKTAEQGTTTMAPYVWKDSPAREVILEDLLAGILPLESDEISAREAWDDVYSNLIEFHGVEYDQYYRNLRNHRVQVAKQLGNSKWLLSALEHDWGLTPRQTKNARGEPVFDMSIAKKFLEMDVKDKKHERMTPATLQTTRDAYKMFRLDIFRQRIHQEVRWQKFLFYLELKRVEKKKKLQERKECEQPQRMSM
jgi:hypothetical protein